MDDFQRRFKGSVDSGLRTVVPKSLSQKAHKRIRRHRAAITAGSSLLLVTLISGVALGISGTTDETTTPPATTTTPSPLPSESADEDGVRHLDWPSPFVPPVTRKDGQTLMPVIFPDKTAATLSYPSELGFAESGIQPTISYSFEDARPNAPHDIIFISGDAPEGLVDPEELETFDTTPFPATLHAVAYERLRGDPPHALIYEAGTWTIVATLPRLEDADTVARNLDLSVTSDGWPTVSARGPLELSEGFGEARGAHLEIGDKDPTFDVADADNDFSYIVMGPIAGCARADEGVSKLGPDWYGSKCLAFTGGDLAIFLSIYGPEQFVRAAHQGIGLSQ